MHWKKAVLKRRPPCVEKIPSYKMLINLFGAGIIIFLILAHSVYKMCIKQEQNTLELWNKLHFEEKRTENIYHV